MANSKVILVFKATKTYKYHNDTKLGRVDDGQLVELSPGEAERYLRDYPKNFFKLGDETEVEEKPKRGKAKGQTKELKEAKTETK